MNRTAYRLLMSACVVACLLQTYQLQSTSSIESVAVAPQSGSPQPFLRLEAGMHTAPIRRIAVDGKERFLVTASHDKSVRVWDLVTGKLLTFPLYCFDQIAGCFPKRTA